MRTKLDAYNEFQNRETWAVDLWIADDEGLYRTIEQWAEEAWQNAREDAVMNREGNAAYDLCDRLEAFFKHNNPLADRCDVYSDLLTHTLYRVDWQALAESLIYQHCC